MTSGLTKPKILNVTNYLKEKTDVLDNNIWNTELSVKEFIFFQNLFTIDKRIVTVHNSLFYFQRHPWEIDMITHIDHMTRKLSGQNLNPAPSGPQSSCSINDIIWAPQFSNASVHHSFVLTLMDILWDFLPPEMWLKKPFFSKSIHYIKCDKNVCQ